MASLQELMQAAAQPEHSLIGLLLSITCSFLDAPSALALASTCTSWRDTTLGAPGVPRPWLLAVANGTEVLQGHGWVHGELSAAQCERLTNAGLQRLVRLQQPIRVWLCGLPLVDHRAFEDSSRVRRVFVQECELMVLQPLHDMLPPGTEIFFGAMHDPYPIIVGQARKCLPLLAVPRMPAMSRLMTLCDVPVQKSVAECEGGWGCLAFASHACVQCGVRMCLACVVESGECDACHRPFCIVCSVALGVHILPNTCHMCT